MNKQTLYFVLLVVLFIFCSIVVINLDGLWTTNKSNNNKLSTDMDLSEDHLLPFTSDDEIALKNGILLSREYQMKLFRDQFENRELGISTFLNELSRLLNIPEIGSYSYGNETVRYQYILDTHSCGKNFNPRVRDYYTGYRANTATMDVKASTDGHDGPEKVSSDTWIPKKEFTKDAMIKFEWDVHPCKIKYSVEGRVYVPFLSNFTTCRDVAKVFERIDEGTKSSKLDNELSTHDLFSGYWYEFEQHGFLSDGITEYKTAITLEYRTLDEAVYAIGVPINSPEWSIRIFSTNHGTGKWSRFAIDDINHRYFDVLDFFGTPDLPCKDEYDMGALDL